MIVDMGRYAVNTVSAFIAGAAIILSSSGFTRADTICLKNGGQVEGVIEKEEAGEYVVQIGFGTINVKKDQVEKVDRSSGEGVKELREAWESKRKELEACEKQFAGERDKRMREGYEDRQRWARERADSQPSGGEAKLQMEGMSHIFVKGRLNDEVDGMFLLDTGAPVSLLTKKTGLKLGIDFSDTDKSLNIYEQRIAGATVRVKRITLKSVSLNDAVAQQVLAEVIIDEQSDVGFIGDGILGMSFLSQFNFHIDPKSKTLTLEKIKK